MKIDLGNYQIPKSCELGKEYEDRIVLFLDVLGTKGLIYKYDEHPNAILHFYDQVQKCVDASFKNIKFSYYHLEHDEDENLDKEFSKIDNFEISYFSDSVIYSLPRIGGERDQFLLEDVIGAVGLTTSLLFHQGIVVRGGLSAGSMFHKNQYCVGPPLIEAINLEKKVKQPVIGIHPKLIGELNERFKSFESDDKIGLYISPLNNISLQLKLVERCNLNDKHKMRESHVDSLFHYFPITLNTITSLLNHKDIDVREKGEWLHEQWQVLYDRLMAALDDGEKRKFSKQIVQFKNRVGNLK